MRRADRLFRLVQLLRRSRSVTAHDFRSFRLDRMAKAELGAVFVDEPGQGLDDFIAWVTKRDAGAPRPATA